MNAESGIPDSQFGQDDWEGLTFLTEARVYGPLRHCLRSQLPAELRVRIMVKIRAAAEDRCGRD